MATPELLAVMIRDGTASESDKMDLYTKVKRFCAKIAGQYRGLLKDPEDEMNDLLQEAYLATMTAAETYDPESGAKFTTWLGFYLRSFYETYIGHQTGRSRGSLYERQKVRKYERDFMLKRGRDPTDEEICDHLGIKPEKLLFLRSVGEEKSLNEQNEDGSLEEIEKLADPHDMEEECLDRIIADEVRMILRRYLSDLPIDERRAVTWIFFKDKTHKQAAQLMGLTPDQFRRHFQAGMRKLRSAKLRDELGRYLPERLGSRAYEKANRNKWQSSTEAAAFRILDLEQMENAKDIRTGMHYKKEM